MENYARCNKVQFIGFPEVMEVRGMPKVVEDLIPELLGIKGKLEIKCIHRVPTQCPLKGDKPCPILAKFWQFSDRDLVSWVVQNMGKLSWDNNNIMLFLDYSQSTMMK